MKMNSLRPKLCVHLNSFVLMQSLFRKVYNLCIPQPPVYCRSPQMEEAPQTKNRVIMKSTDSVCIGHFVSLQLFVGLLFAVLTDGLTIVQEE